MKRTGARDTKLTTEPTTDVGTEQHIETPTPTAPVIDWSQYRWKQEVAAVSDIIGNTLAIYAKMGDKERAEFHNHMRQNGIPELSDTPTPEVFFEEFNRRLDAIYGEAPELYVIFAPRDMLKAAARIHLSAKGQRQMLRAVNSTNREQQPSWLSQCGDVLLAERKKYRRELRANQQPINSMADLLGD